MKFTKNLISLGRGRISSATVIEGVLEVVVKSDGKLLKKNMKENTRQVYGSRLVGYCDDLWILPACTVERLGEELVCKNAD